MRFLTLLLGCTTILAAADVVQDPIPVLFTGRLLGYFRIPDRQLLTTNRCVDGLAPDSPQVQALRAEIAARSEGKPHLLLGLGDNFAPDFLSRFAFDGANPIRKDVLTGAGTGWVNSLTGPAPEAVDLAEKAGRNDIPFDNVACFLKLAGYDAVVPGKHDFYYGPERLRQYARFLAQGEHPTMMLGANLAIVTTTKKTARKADPRKDALKVDLPDLVLPWRQQYPVEEAYDFLAEPGADPKAPGRTKGDFSPQAVILGIAGSDTLEVLDGGSIHRFTVHWNFIGACALPIPASSAVVPLTCAPGGSRLQFRPEDLIGRHPDGTAVASLPAPAGGAAPSTLAPGLYRFFVDPAKGGSARYQDFTVERPFFQYPEPSPAASPVKPYLLTGVGGQPVAVFGIVDGALKEHVGLLNYSWLNTNPDLNTQVSVGEPTAALEQALQYCLATAECRGTRKILLAQMPYEQAQLLAGKVRFFRNGRTRELAFDLVLAQSDDRHAAVTQTRSQDQLAPFVLAPGQIFNANDETMLHIRLYKAVLGRHLEQGRRKMDLVLTATQRTPLRAAGNVDYPDQERSALPPGYSRSAFQTKALESMRQLHKTDVAFFQRRDVFDIPNHLVEARGRTHQQEMDIVFWKGDFVVRVDVTGATLKAVLDQSKRFEQQDANALDSSPESGRGLVVLGAFADKDKNYLVNGAVIDPNRLYSVATTDFMAFGDTGYIGLSAVSPSRIGDFELIPLSNLVCRGVFPADPSCGPVRLAPDRYFDATSASVIDVRPAAKPYDELKSWFTHVRAPAAPKSVAEQKAQDHTFWSVTLEKAAVSYSAYHHSPASQKLLQDQFAGIPQTQVLTPNSIAIGSEFRLRIVRSGARFDRYLLFEEAYEHDVKQTNSDTRVDSQASNLLAGESGLTYRLTPDGRRLPTVRLLAGLRVETNPWHPLTSFSLADGSTLVRPIDRLTKIPGKFGGRVENKVSWLEFGYQISKNVGAPTGYDFVDRSGPTTVTLHCDAIAAEKKNSFAACLKGNAGITSAADVTADTQTRWQHGLFLNFKVQVPIFNKQPYSVQYVSENTGNLYYRFGNQPQYSLEPRYLDTWTNSLVVKLIGNLSIAPKVQYLMYENQVDRNRMTALSTSIALQYTFGWHSGMLWKDALQYPDATLKPAK